MDFQGNLQVADRAVVNQEEWKDRFSEMTQIALEYGNYQGDVNSAVSLTFKTSKFSCGRAPNWQEKPRPLMPPALLSIRSNKLVPDRGQAMSIDEADLEFSGVQKFGRSSMKKTMALVCMLSFVSACEVAQQIEPVVPLSEEPNTVETAVGVGVAAVLFSATALLISLTLVVNDAAS